MMVKLIHIICIFDKWLFCKISPNFERECYKTMNPLTRDNNSKLTVGAIILMILISIERIWNENIVK